jgi:type IV secretion system protein VirB4
MNDQQIALFESLRDREGLYIRRDGLTKVITLNLDSRSYAAFSTKAEGPRASDKADRQVRPHRRHCNRFAQGEIE